MWVFETPCRKLTFKIIPPVFTITYKDKFILERGICFNMRSLICRSNEKNIWMIKLIREIGRSKNSRYHFAFVMNIYKPTQFGWYIILMAFCLDFG